MIEILQVLLVILLNNIIILGGIFLLILYIRKATKKTVKETGYMIQSNLETIKIIMGKKGGDNE